MQKIIQVILVPFVLLIATGCSPVAKYRVTVDAITNTQTNIAPSTYQLKALSEKTDENSLTYQRHASQLIKILNAKGYAQPYTPTSAEQIIHFDYGIEKIKEERRTYTEPNINMGFSWGLSNRYHNRRYHPFWNDFGYNSYQTYQKTYQIFSRYIIILATNPSGKELWRVDVASVGESNELSSIVPLLIKAAKPYIGTNTNKPIKLTIKDTPKKKKNKKE